MDSTLSSQEITAMVNNILIFVGLVTAVILVCVTLMVRARYAQKRRWEGDGETVPPMFSKLLDKAMAERDAHSNQLQQRIEVLERIVTDGHKRHALSEDIDSLKQ